MKKSALAVSLSLALSVFAISAYADVQKIEVGSTDENLSISPDNQQGVWYSATSDSSVEFVGAGEKQYSLTFDKTNKGTSTFLKAEGNDASVLVHNLDRLEFKAGYSSWAREDSSIAIVTSKGGTATFDNINTVQLGTAEAPLWVDQIVHANWAGGNVKFSNIGTFNAHAIFTAFLIQAQPDNFPSLIFENINEVNINAGTGRNGIQIAASGTPESSETFFL